MNTTLSTHAIGRCVCGFGIAVKGAEETNCPNCGLRVHLTYVKGSYNGKVPCNSDCQYALGPACSCSCGSENHGAGYIPVNMVPAWIRARDFEAAQKKIAAAQTRAARERDAQAAARADLLDAHPLLAHVEEFAWESDFLTDMWAALSRGSMTPAQIAGAERTITAMLRRRAEQQARLERQHELAASGVRVPTGKHTFGGTIITARTERGYRGIGFETKMLVEADAGWRVWATVPKTLLPTSYTGEEFAAALDALRGQRVTVTGTIKPSVEDPLFGFLSRPKVTLVG